jgi:hypothetical protein
VTFDSFGVGPVGTTTDADGSWSTTLGNSGPMGLVAFTVQALGQTFVATLQDPCQGTGPDTIAPTILVPPTMTLDATTPQGAVVNYTVQVVDDRLPTPPAHCAPASGTTFPAGQSVVTCVATDAAGNTGTATFQVVVRSASDQLAKLRSLVISSNLPDGLTSALTAKLDAAERSANTAQLTAACGQTRAFAQQVEAQSGKNVATGTAALLVLEVLRIRPALACPPLSVHITMPVLVLKPACNVTSPDVGPGGPYGVALTLDDFPPDVTVTIVFYTSSLNTSLSHNVVTDAVGGAGPIYGASPVPVGTVTATAFVDGIQLAQTSIQDPCVT